MPITLNMCSTSDLIPILHAEGVRWASSQARGPRLDEIKAAIHDIGLFEGFDTDALTSAQEMRLVGAFLAGMTDAA